LIGNICPVASISRSLFSGVDREILSLEILPVIEPDDFVTILEGR
jgi:hypothetical protein